MRNIDLYKYKDEPFTIYRKKGIYTLNDEGKKRYISDISHNYNYVDIKDPRVYRQIVSVKDESVPLSMREIMWVNRPNPFENEEIFNTEPGIPIPVTQTEKIVEEQKTEPQPQTEIKKEENICRTEQPKAIKRKIKGKCKRKLPPINLNKSTALPKIENEKVENAPCETEGNVLMKNHKKLTLPDVMKSQSLKYKTIIANIHLIGSKEFGPNYNPYASCTKTGDTIRTNVYGAKFQH